MSMRRFALRSRWARTPRAWITVPLHCCAVDRGIGPAPLCRGWKTASFFTDPEAHWGRPFVSMHGEGAFPLSIVEFTRRKAAPLLLEFTGACNVHKCVYSGTACSAWLRTRFSQSTGSRAGRSFLFGVWKSGALTRRNMCFPLRPRTRLAFCENRSTLNSLSLLRPI